MLEQLHISEAVLKVLAVVFKWAWASLWAYSTSTIIKAWSHTSMLLSIEQWRVCGKTVAHESTLLMSGLSAFAPKELFLGLVWPLF